MGCCLLVLNRIFGSEPFPPAALEGLNIFEALTGHFLCHTGTGVFAGSGAVGYVTLVLGVLGDPLIKILWIGPNGAFDFELG